MTSQTMHLIANNEVEKKHPFQVPVQGMHPIENNRRQYLPLPVHSAGHSSVCIKYALVIPKGKVIYGIVQSSSGYLNHEVKTQKILRNKKTEFHFITWMLTEGIHCTDATVSYSSQFLWLHPNDSIMVCRKTSNSLHWFREGHQSSLAF